MSADAESSDAYAQLLLARGWPSTLDELDALSTNDAAFCVLYAANAGVTNGGFESLFYNPSGWYAARIPAAAARFALPTHEAAAQKALSIFEGEYPTDFRVRDELWDELCDSRGSELDRIIEPCSRAWWGAQDELYAALARCARQA